MLQKSEKIDLLASALCDAQAEFSGVPMNCTNKFLGNKYADLGAIIQTVKPILAKHGLSVTQGAIGGADFADMTTIGVSTTLMHKSGQWVETEIYMKVGDEKGKSAAQVAGSVISYLRRYSIAAILNLYSDEDVDGNAPEKERETNKAPQPQTLAKQAAAVSKVPVLTIEEAEAEVSGATGELYGELSNEDITYRLNGMLKVKDKLPDQIRKIEACKLILAERAKGRPIKTKETKE